jgi:hypothetical protein
MHFFCAWRPIALAAAAQLLIATASLGWAIAAEQSPPWPTPMPSGLTPGPPMRFMVVKSASASCQPNCPEWVSAEGDITIGSARTFVHFIAGLRGRRLPILIDSRGGSFVDAMAMGRVIRAQRLVVAVAHTYVRTSPCRGEISDCEVPGAAITLNAECMSACALVLAGGVGRYIDALSKVGVGQLSLGLRTMGELDYLIRFAVVEGATSRTTLSFDGHETSASSATARNPVVSNPSVMAYLKEMGIREPVSTFMLTRSANAIHVMTQVELASSRLETAETAETPILLAEGPQGLSASPIGLSSQVAEALSMTTRSPLARPIEGRRAIVLGNFKYRPGGAAIYATFGVLDAETGKMILRSQTGSYLLGRNCDTLSRFDERKPGFAAAGSIPRDVFCRLRGSRRALVEFAEPSFDAADGERRREYLARIDFAAAPAEAPLFAEVCSGPMAAAKR